MFDDIKLTWTVPNDNGSPVQRYWVYRRASPGTEKRVAAVSNVTTWTDTSTSACIIRCYYRVSAENEVGEGPKSNETSVKL